MDCGTHSKSSAINCFSLSIQLHIEDSKELGLIFATLTERRFPKGFRRLQICSEKMSGTP